MRRSVLVTNPVFVKAVQGVLPRLVTWCKHSPKKIQSSTQGINPYNVCTRVFTQTNDDAIGDLQNDQG